MPHEPTIAPRNPGTNPPPDGGMGAGRWTAFGELATLDHPSQRGGRRFTNPKLSVRIGGGAKRFHRNLRPLSQQITVDPVDDFSAMIEQSVNMEFAMGTLPPGSAELDVDLATVESALERGQIREARQLIKKAAAVPSIAHSGAWARLFDMGAWPDAWLVAAVRLEPPDEDALDTLVARHWQTLYARCQLLTLNPQHAVDLAQEAWCRILRARALLKPDGNFPAYLTTIATNLWRDSHRAARRAGPLALDQLASLDAALPGREEEGTALRDVLPDLNALQAEERTLLRVDIDHALAQLTPLLRDVLVARYLAGESCTEIGKRYRRTEQTVSGWVREAVRQMRRYMKDAGGEYEANR